MRERVRGLSTVAARDRGASARIDDLNVYPVPDGDTGHEPDLTVRAIAEAPPAKARTTAPESRKRYRVLRSWRAGQLRRHPLADRPRATIARETDDLARASVC